MIENLILYELPKPKTLNLEYLYYYLLIRNLNFYMKRYKHRATAETLTSEHMNMTSRQILRQRQAIGMEYSNKEKLFYISSNNRILRINQENPDPELLKLNYS